MMRILTEENCDSCLVEQLRAAGHDVRHAAEHLKGRSDISIFEAAAEDGRVLFTNDLDFGLLAERSTQPPPAIVLLRLHPLRAGMRAEIAVEFFANVGWDWQKKFIVVEPGLTRRRRMLP